MTSHSTAATEHLKPLLSLLAISLFLGFCFEYFFYDQERFGINVLLYTSFIILGLCCLAMLHKKHMEVSSAWLIVPILFFACMVFFRASAFLTVLNVFAIMGLLLLLARTIILPHLTQYRFKAYVQSLFLPLQAITPFFSTLGEVISLKATITHHRTLWQVLRGVVIALPILFLFIFLFSSADLIFGTYVAELIHIELSPELIVKSVRILLVTAVFIGMYALIFRISPAEKSAQVTTSTQKKYALGLIESSILLTSLNVLFLIFISIQFAYLFSGGANIAALGFTYAEYARKGFFELIAVALFSLLILWTTERYSERKEGRHSVLYQVLSSVLVLQVGIVMLSAFKRLSLYEEAFGFTTLRLYSHVFIIWIAVVFGLFLYTLFVDRREHVFAFHLFLSMLVFLISMNLLNPDAFIARKNVERYQATGKLDAEYLFRSISDDAAGERVQAFDLAEGEVKNQLGYELYRWSSQRTQEVYGWEHWPSMNISTINATERYTSRMSEWQQYKRLRIDTTEKTF